MELSEQQIEYWRGQFLYKWGDDKGPAGGASRRALNALKPVAK